MIHAGARLAWHALLVVLIAAGLALVPPAPTTAVELPPAGSAIFIQTNGPTAPIALGDWYSAITNGIGGGYHYVYANIPCRWPANLDVHLDLYSPEMNFSAPAPRIDENSRSAPDATFFELYAPGTPVNLPREPGPGAPGSIVSQSFQPTATQPERWVRFHTLRAPVACGSYLLRTATAEDSENGWRLRVGYDTDADPNNTPPPNYDNPDGSPGSGDEATISILQTTYQHVQTGRVECMLHYQFVKPGLPEVRFHNFDLDNNERVTYYPPSAVLSLNGDLTPGAIAGTVSGFTLWNNGTQTDRGTGDVVINPEPGWWRMVTCVRDFNQFNQEGISGEPTFREPPPEPDMVVSKDDGRTIVAGGETLTYTIVFTNQALTSRPNPGAAFDVTITDTLPPNTSYRGCGFASPGLRGSCGLQGNQVVFRLDDPVFAGASGAVTVTVSVNGNATGEVVNTVALDYTDLLANPYPTERDDDVNRLQPGQGAPILDTLKTARLTDDRNGDGRANPGEVVEYMITVRNSGSAAATNVIVRDEPDRNTLLVPGSVRLVPGGTVLTGNAPGDTVVTANLGVIDPNASASVIFDVEVLASVPPGVTELVNQATTGADGVPDQPSDDPDTPEPDDPTRVPFVPPGTAVTLTSLTAQPWGDGAIVRWSTGLELNTEGFELWRATGPDRGSARVITPLIPASGAGSGYEWHDRGLTPGVAYFYWLVEVEYGGARTEFGPVRMAAGRPSATELVHLPLLQR
ncbi:MAG: hypothetical protein OHK0015_30230 [Chloroflexi bacterium OHK40]